VELSRSPIHAVNRFPLRSFGSWKSFRGAPVLLRTDSDPPDLFRAAVQLRRCVRFRRAPSQRWRSAATSVKTDAPAEALIPWPDPFLSRKRAGRSGRIRGSTGDPAGAKWARRAWDSSHFTKSSVERRGRVSSPIWTRSGQDEGKVRRLYGPDACYNNELPSGSQNEFLLHTQEVIGSRPVGPIPSKLLMRQ
jgi:hypothetical protein